MKLSLCRPFRLVPAFACLAALACGTPADAPVLNVGQTEAALTGVTSFGANPGNLTMLKYVPAKMPAGPRPLVVAMHGCTQTPDTYVAAGWNNLADQWGFYVVYPQQNTGKNNQLGCFNWGGRWPSAPNDFPVSSETLDTTELTRGYGENESIKEMVDQMKKDHTIDAARVFVTGLSAGGGMVSVMLAVWPDVFAAGAIMAGVPYGCAMVKKTTAEASGCLGDYSTGQNAYLTRTPQAWADLVHNASPTFTGARPRVSIWHGTSDGTVNFHSEGEIVKQWTQVLGASQTPAVTEQVDGFPHKVWKDPSGKAVVEAYEITGQGHGTMVAPSKPVDPATPGGEKCGAAGSYILSAGICSTYYAGKFFGLDGATTAGGDGGASSGGSSGGGTSGGASSGGTRGGTSGASGGNGATASSSGTGGASGSGGTSSYSTSGLAGCSASPGDGARGGAGFAFAAIGLAFAGRRVRRGRRVSARGSSSARCRAATQHCR